MSNEVYNLYKRVGVKWPTFPIYPALSSYQQLELFKVVCHGRWIEMAQKAFSEGTWYAGGVDYKRHVVADSFEEAVCGLINKFWNTLNDTDQKKIKEILSTLQ